MRTVGCTGNGAAHRPLRARSDLSGALPFEAWCPSGREEGCGGGGKGEYDEQAGMTTSGPASAAPADGARADAMVAGAANSPERRP